jgi:hypothetical protein
MPTGDYHDQASTALTVNYVFFRFTTPHTRWDLCNDDALLNVLYSFDGINQAGVLFPGDVYKWEPKPGDYSPGVYLKSNVANASYRLMTAEGA